MVVLVGFFNNIHICVRTFYIFITIETIYQQYVYTRNHRCERQKLLGEARTQETCAPLECFAVGRKNHMKETDSQSWAADKGACCDACKLTWHMADRLLRYSNGMYAVAIR